MQDSNKLLGSSTGRLSELEDSLSTLTAENDRLKDGLAAQDEHINQLQHRIRQLEGGSTISTTLTVDNTATLDQLQKSLKEQRDQSETARRHALPAWHTMECSHQTFGQVFAQICLASPDWQSLLLHADTYTDSLMHLLTVDQPDPSE